MDKAHDLVDGIAIQGMREKPPSMAICINSYAPVSSGAATIRVRCTHHLTRRQIAHAQGIAQQATLSLSSSKKPPRGSRSPTARSLSGEWARPRQRCACCARRHTQKYVCAAENPDRHGKQGQRNAHQPDERAGNPSGYWIASDFGKSSLSITCKAVMKMRTPMTDTDCPRRAGRLRRQ